MAHPFENSGHATGAVLHVKCEHDAEPDVRTVLRGGMLWGEQVCLAGSLQEDDCKVSTHNCWTSGTGNDTITACKDTFRGYVCQCPSGLLAPNVAASTRFWTVRALEEPAAMPFVLICRVIFSNVVPAHY